MSRRSRQTNERSAGVTEEKTESTKDKKAKALMAALSTEFQIAGWKPLSTAEVPRVYTPPLQLPLPLEPQPPLFELFIQKWKALAAGWKVLAGTEIMLAAAAIIVVSAVVFPKVVVTAVLVSAIALIVITVVGHLAHIAMTPVRKAKKPTISDLVPNKRKRKSSASNDGPEALTSSFAF